MDGEIKNFFQNAASRSMHPHTQVDEPSQDPPVVTSPWFMQRPQSSEMNTTTFSFSRPANPRQAFTRNLPPKRPIIPAPAASSVVRETHAVPAIQTGPSTGESRNASSPAAEETRPPETLSSSNPPSAVQDDSPLANRGRSAEGPSQMDRIMRETAPNRMPNPTTQQTSNDVRPASHTASTGNCDSNITRASTSESAQGRDQREGASTADSLLAQGPPALQPGNRSPARDAQPRKSKPTKLQKTNAIKAAVQQLTEDRLFELLIGRIRQREENEANAALTKRQMESENDQLKQENQDLKKQVELSHQLLHESNKECEAKGSLLGEWKGKIRKFKLVVNEMGQGYDALREEADQLRETVLSLGKEKGELTEIINEIKLRISRAEGAAEIQQSKNQESERTIAVLEKALQSSQEREKVVEGQLSEQKKRSASLESYIQKYSLVQIKQLGLIKEGQQDLFEKLATDIHDSSQDAMKSKTAVMLAIADAFETCRSSMQNLTERFSEEQVSVADFTKSGQDLVGRIDSLSSEFMKNIEGCIKINNGVSKTIQKKFQDIERNFGSESLLTKRLDRFNTSYEALKEKLDTIEPSLETLSGSVKEFTATEGILARDMKDLSRKLAEVPVSNSALGTDLARKFAQNTELQVQLHDKFLEIDQLNHFLCAEKTTIEDLEKSLSDATAKNHESEAQNKRLELEKVALEAEVKANEYNVRQELNGKSFDLFNRMKADHQAQVDELQKEKADVEKAAGELVSQLKWIENSLIEAKELVNEHSREREALLEERDQRIQQLEEKHADSMTQLTIQREEIQKFQELDATSRVENSDLRDRLEQAEQKVHDLELQVTHQVEAEHTKAPTAPGIVPFAAIQNKLPTQPDTSAYGESCDFAMLFMSDDPCLSTQEQDSPQKSSKKPRDIGINDIENISQSQRRPSMSCAEEVIPSPQNKKRKAVNFKPQKAENKKNKASKTTPAETQVQSVTRTIETQVEGSPKVSRHTQKWTYSRVHSSSATHIQREQTKVPLRAENTERRSTPKGLVSASSSQAAAQPPARGRGRRRSRGEQYDARFQNN